MQKGNMENRILELALETLIARRTAIEAEIAEIRSELERLSPGARSTSRARLAGRRRRVRTPAERKAQSKRMKIYWARRRAEAARNAAVGREAARNPKGGR